MCLNTSISRWSPTLITQVDRRTQQDHWYLSIHPIKVRWSASQRGSWDAFTVPHCYQKGKRVLTYVANYRQHFRQLNLGDCGQAMKLPLRPSCLSTLSGSQCVVIRFSSTVTLVTYPIVKICDKFNNHRFYQH